MEEVVEKHAPQFTSEILILRQTVGFDQLSEVRIVDHHKGHTRRMKVFVIVGQEIRIRDVFIRQDDLFTLVLFKHELDHTAAKDFLHTIHCLQFLPQLIAFRKSTGHDNLARQVKIILVDPLHGITEIADRQKENHRNGNGYCNDRSLDSVPFYVFIGKLSFETEDPTDQRQSPQLLRLHFYRAALAKGINGHDLGCFKGRHKGGNKNRHGSTDDNSKDHPCGADYWNASPHPFRSGKDLRFENLFAKKRQSDFCADISYEKSQGDACGSQKNSLEKNRKALLTARRSDTGKHPEITQPFRQ